MRWDMPGTGWRNTEYRSFNFAILNQSHPSILANGTNTDGHVDDYENATLRETEESRARRGKDEPQNGREKQTELFNAAMQGWEDQSKQSLDEIGKEGDEDVDEGMVRVLTSDSENKDKKGGEAPATDGMGEAVADAAGRERNNSKSVSVAA